MPADRTYKIDYFFSRLKESGAINGSLFALSQVVDSLNQGLVRLYYTVSPLNIFSTVSNVKSIGKLLKFCLFERKNTIYLWQICSKLKSVPLRGYDEETDDISN